MTDPKERHYFINTPGDYAAVLSAAIADGYRPVAWPPGDAALHLRQWVQARAVQRARPATEKQAVGPLPEGPTITRQRPTYDVEAYLEGQCQEAHGDVYGAGQWTVAKPEFAGRWRRAIWAVIDRERDLVASGAVPWHLKEAAPAAQQRTVEPVTEQQAVERAIAAGGRSVPAYGNRGNPVLLYPDQLADLIVNAARQGAAP